jgi:hypothetical protein
MGTIFSRVWAMPNAETFSILPISILIPSRAKVTKFADDFLYRKLNVSRLELAAAMMKMPGINRIEVTDYDGNGESLRK